VRRLAEEPLDVAAPLLIRPHALSDIDLIALIGRYGLPHARAIARRKHLNPAIADLIRALEKPTLVRTSATQAQGPVEKGATETPRALEKTSEASGHAAEAVRERLLSMMAAERRGERAATVNAPTGSTYASLRGTALTGNAALFQTALADALGLDFATARSLAGGASYASLLVALKALDLSEDKAFLIAVAVFPRLFPHPEAIRIFLDRYRTLHPDAAQRKVDGWKAAHLAEAVHHIVHAPANADTRPSTGDRAAGPAPPHPYVGVEALLALQPRLQGFAVLAGPDLDEEPLVGPGRIIACLGCGTIQRRFAGPAARQDEDGAGLGGSTPDDGREAAGGKHPAQQRRHPQVSGHAHRDALSPYSMAARPPQLVRPISRILA